VRKLTDLACGTKQEGSSKDHERQREQMRYTGREGRRENPKSRAMALLLQGGLDYQYFAFISCANTKEFGT